MPNPYRIHSPPPSFNVALLSLRSRVLNAPTANIDGLGKGLGLIVVDVEQCPRAFIFHLPVSILSRLSFPKLVGYRLQVRGS